MCRGVTNGLAGIKFSGSPKSHGLIKQIYKKILKKIANPIKSFQENKDEIVVCQNSF
jgi:hypothetical protein